MRYFRSTRRQKQAKNLVENNSVLIVFDTETTGLEDDAKIIQFAAQKLKVYRINNKVIVEKLDTINMLINPQWPLSGEIVELTHITDEMLQDAPTETEAIEKIREFLGNKPILAAYNIGFDLKKMIHMYKRCGYEFNPAGCFDILEMVRDINPRLSVNERGEKNKPYQLINVAHAYRLDDGIDFHNANDDVEATVRVLNLCLNEYYQNPKVEGFEELQVRSVTLPKYANFTPSFTDKSLYINTNRGLLYFNTFYKYYASSEIDLRFVNILKLENDVCRLTETNPYTLHKYKNKVFAKGGSFV